MTIHEADRSAAPFATQILGGKAPSETSSIGEGLQVIPLPGHTRGGIALLIDETWLFTGDSLCWSLEHERLHAFRDACWYSWPVLKDSLAALDAFDFEQVFSGHGSWSPRLGVEDMRGHLRELVARM